MWYLINSWKLLSENSPPSLEKIHSPSLLTLPPQKKNSKSASPHFLLIFQPPQQNGGGHYVTHIIQPLFNNLPSCIKDTKHFLNLIEKLPPLPPNALLVTAVMSCPYTKTLYMVMIYHPSFISWRNTSISYPQTAQLPL